MKSLPIKIIVPILLALLLLASLFAFTPLGNALANSVIKFFHISGQSSFPVPTVLPPVDSSKGQSYLLELVPAPVNSLASSSTDLPDQRCQGEAISYACQIKSAEQAVGFEIKEFPADPQGLFFISIQAIAAMKEVRITYEVVGGGGSLDFVQGTGELSDSLWGSVPADAVEIVQIGDFPGEYVQGIFTSDGSGEARWNSDAPVQRLRWQDGDHWFSLEKNGDPYPIEYLDREGMVALSASLVDTPQQNGNQLRSDHLTSISDAETLSGINLVEPTLLPEGFTFNYAQYNDQDHSVKLVYNNPGLSDDIALIILVTPLGYIGGIEMGYHEGDGYQSLAWNTDKLYFKIIFVRGQWFNGQLDETRMAEIAHSMH